MGDAQSPIFSSEALHHPIVAKTGMVASQHGLASQVGVEILQKGGNAVDAAVGVGFALAVVLPRAGNLGGGGFMLIHLNDQNKSVAINYRETAPKASHKDMYLNEEGDVDKKKFNSSYHSIGVPGTVAGLTHALEKYGSLPLQEVIAPAIRLAKEGFPITFDLARLLKKYEKRMKACEYTQDIFYKADGYYDFGEQIVQTDLAWSLEQISKHGKSAFYKGEIAKRITEDIQSHGGIITMQDLSDYQVEEVDLVTGHYRGYQIASMPPPSSGGVHVIQILNMLEHYPIGLFGHNSAMTIHLMTEAMRLAYADRSEHLGDPNFWDVPANGIISKKYAEELSKKINTYHATDSEDVKPGPAHDYESEETTHFSVIDSDGNMVSNTYTLNFSFGTGLVAKGTGILLNNEMGDFSAKPGSANAYGLIGGEANAVEPGKRPLSSMTPIFVFDKKGEPIMTTGSPGGSRIITTVLQVIMNVIDHNMNIAEATHATRVHHQWYPDVLYYDGYLSPDTQNILASKGHTVKRRAAMGSTQTLMIQDGLILGCSDPRRPDGRTMGY